MSLPTRPLLSAMTAMVTTTLCALAMSGHAHAQEPATQPAEQPAAAPDTTAPTPKPTPGATGAGTAPAAAPAGTKAKEAAKPAPAKQRADAAGDEDEDELDEELDGDGSSMTIGPIEVTATPEELSRMGGSAQKIDKKRLEQYEYDDAHSVLKDVPGLYVRQEDGMGLRPNIGIRGANSERSKKITLMEDGVLFGPAPYAAPAAYYFPLMTRMTAIDIYKGPGAVLFGPQTIGGALNLSARQVPMLKSSGQLDLALGAFPVAGRLPTGKFHGYYGIARPWGGLLVEGVQLGSAGFKELDNGDPTGFNKTEIMVRGRLNTDLSKPRLHALDLKLGFSREASNETYVGLTDADFRAQPNRRYNGTQLDRMEWYRVQLQATHTFEISEKFKLTTDLYHHHFDRSWRKLNGFAQGTTLEDVLANPATGRNAVLYDILTGAENSTSAQEALILGTNKRVYGSQGLQTRGRWEKKSADGKTWSNRLEFGARLHRDWVERDHTAERFMMQDNALERLQGDTTVTNTDNRGEAQALAVYALDTLFYKNFTIAPGLRVEAIRTRLTNNASGDSTTNSDVVLIPGVGTHYAFTKTFGALAGVHRGFSPVAPGQSDAVDPETSVNYEAGVRYLNLKTETSGELIGFFNNYGNLIGDCTFASGCDDRNIGDQFNGGRVHVYGLEAQGQTTIKLSRDLKLPLRAAYTLTLSEFQTAFSSENPQFADVEVGDELPYVPRHQAAIGAGLAGERWSVDASLAISSKMREEASQGDLDPARTTDAYAMLDLAMQYRFSKRWLGYLRVDNALNAQPIVSRRPQGARPSRPMLTQLGVKLDL